MGAYRLFHLRNVYAATLYARWLLNAIWMGAFTSVGLGNVRPSRSRYKNAIASDASPRMLFGDKPQESSAWMQKGRGPLPASAHNGPLHLCCAISLGGYAGWLSRSRYKNAIASESTGLCPHFKWPRRRCHRPGSSIRIGIGASVLGASESLSRLELFLAMSGLGQMRINSFGQVVSHSL